MADNRRFFANERRAWAAVLLYTVFLYGTLTLTFDLYRLIYRQIGQDTMSLTINLLFLLVGIGLLAFVLRTSRLQAGPLVAFLLIGLATAFSLWQLHLPAKRMHFFQYAPLTLLVLEAVSFRCFDRYRYVWTLAVVALIGVGDESIQGVLEKRYFGLADTVVNAAAGLLTLAFVAFVTPQDTGRPISSPVAASSDPSRHRGRSHKA